MLTLCLRTGGVLARPTIKLTVVRRTDNRAQDLPDDSPLAWELHRSRGQVVHEELEGDPEWTVLHWGGTDDETSTHEGVTVILELAEAAGTVALGFGGAVLYRALLKFVWVPEWLRGLRGARKRLSF